METRVIRRAGFLLSIGRNRKHYMFNQIVSSGVINTDIVSDKRQSAPLFYGPVTALDNPSNITQSLEQAGLTFTYATEPLFNENLEPIERMQKLITIDKKGNKSTQTHLRYKDHLARIKWNDDNPGSMPKDLIRRHAKDNFLDIVGKDYKLHQPEQVYKAYLELSNYLGLQIHMAGVINNGHSIWARVKLDKDIEVKDAKIAQYISIMTGVSKSTKAGESPEDVACFNQWNLLLNNTEWYLGNVSHRGLFYPEQFAKTINERLNYAQKERELIALIETQCQEDEKRDYFKNVLFADFANKEKIAKNSLKLERYIEMSNSKPCKVDAEARHNTWYGSFMDATWIEDRFPSRDMSGLGSGLASSNLTGQIGKFKANAYIQALRQPQVLQALAA